MDIKDYFSAVNRKLYLKKLKETTFDVLIIGGGITGVSLALDAVLRGLKVALIEHHDFAAGLSGVNTGLFGSAIPMMNLCKTTDIGVYSGEKRIIYNWCPHLFIPQKTFLLINNKDRLSRIDKKISLRIANLLAGEKNSQTIDFLSPEEVLKKEKALNEKLNSNAIAFNEYKIEYNRLLIELLKKAHSMGLVVLNYMRISALKKHEEAIKETLLTDTFTGKVICVKSRIVVNSTSKNDYKLSPYDNPFVNEAPNHRIQFFKFVFKGKLPKLSSAILKNGEGGSSISFIPLKDKLLVNLIVFEELRLEETSEEKALDIVNKSMNEIFAGNYSYKQQLVSKRNKSWEFVRTKRSICDNLGKIKYSKTGQLSVSETFFSKFRKQAAGIVDIIFDKYLDDRKKTSSTLDDSFRLNCSAYGFDASQMKITEYADHKYDEVKQIGISVEAFYDLFHRYGTEIDKIIDFVYEHQTKYSKLELWVRAEVNYAIHHEMCANIVDFYCLHTGQLYYNPTKVEKESIIVLDEFSKILNWSPKERLEHYQSLQNVLAACCNVSINHTNDSSRH